MIELVNVTRAYGEGASLVKALDDANLSIAEGEFVVVLGPSGSGKTTLLNIVGALDTPTSGTVSIAGRDITGAKRGDLFAVRRQTVSFIFQGFNLFPGLTAAENVQFAIDAAGRKGGPAADAVLESVGLGGRGHQFPGQLSGGEQQRVAIARAVAKNPAVLLCDEPTGALDVHTGILVLEAISRINSELGTTTAVITHNAIIADMADRVISISDGKISHVHRNSQKRVASELTW